MISSDILPDRRQRSLDLKQDLGDLDANAFGEEGIQHVPRLLQAS